jgi:hypothetical protein
MLSGSARFVAPTAVRYAQVSLVSAMALEA